jgi:peptidoglycan hydrolase CwlO-like protein
MSKDRHSLLIASLVVLIVLSVDVSLTGRSAAQAQQHNASDLEFARERGQISAAEKRIESLNRRVAALQESTSANATREHVLLGRDVGIPPSSQDTTPEVTTEKRQRDSDRRVPQTIKHRDRAVTTDDIATLRRRLAAAQQSTRSLGERVNRPDFGAGIRSLNKELDEIESRIQAAEQDTHTLRN